MRWKFKNKKLAKNTWKKSRLGDLNIFDSLSRPSTHFETSQNFSWYKHWQVKPKNWDCPFFIDSPYLFSTKSSLRSRKILRIIFSLESLSRFSKMQSHFQINLILWENLGGGGRILVFYCISCDQIFQSFLKGYTRCRFRKKERNWFKNAVHVKFNILKTLNHLDCNIFSSINHYLNENKV
jgi:hypothetical protein